MPPTKNRKSDSDRRELTVITPVKANVVGAAAQALTGMKELLPEPAKGIVATLANSLTLLQVCSWLRTIFF